MTGKGKPRTPPDLMSELLGSLQQDPPLPGQRPSEPSATETPTSQQVAISSRQPDNKTTGRLVDLSTRPQSLKTQLRKRDGTELTRKTHYLTPEQVKLLKEFAFMTDQGESEVVRQALDEFFERHGHEVWST